MNSVVTPTPRSAGHISPRRTSLQNWLRKHRLLSGLLAIGLSLAYLTFALADGHLVVPVGIAYLIGIATLTLLVHLP